MLLDASEVRVLLDLERNLMFLCLVLPANLDVCESPFSVPFLYLFFISRLSIKNNVDFGLVLNESKS